MPGLGIPSNRPLLFQVLEGLDRLLDGRIEVCADFGPSGKVVLG